MKHLLRIQDMRTCWRSACGQCPPPCVPSLALVRQVVLLSREISDRTSEIRRCLKEDYEAHIQNIVVEAVSAAEKHDFRGSRGEILPCLPMFGLRMAPSLRPPGRLRRDGSVFTLPRSLRRSAWWRPALLSLFRSGPWALDRWLLHRGGWGHPFHPGSWQSHW